MTLHTNERMPITIYANPGQTFSLSAVLSQAFGSEWAIYKNFWLGSNSAAELTAWNFSYWDPAHPAVGQWSIAGKQVLPGGGQSTYVAAANINSVTFAAGNSILNTLYVAIDRSPVGVDQVTTFYRINIVPAQVSGPPIAPPTPNDIVATANNFDLLYNGVPNSNDCSWITDAVGGAAGAVLPSDDQSIDPTQNREGGYWRIVHRGTDNPVADWQSLVQPGDIVRFDWADPNQPQHTTLIMGYQQPNGKISVFDNNKRTNGSTSIGIHDADYDTFSAARSVTVYRLSTDKLYLVNGTELAEISTGTGLADDIRTFGGDDRVYAGSGNDRIRAGSGNDQIDGGSGLDVCTYSGARIQYTISVAAGTTAVADNLLARDGIDKISNVERLHFSDGVVALDTAGTAGQSYRMYQAAFARNPDKDGVSYWISEVDKGMSLHDLALAFIGSAEFKGIYGANPSVQTLVSGFYTNVLGRAPDASGLSFWVGQVQSGLSTADMLVSFSESGENKAHVAPAIQNGIELSLSFFA